MTYREDVMQPLIMIRPRVYSYGFNGQRELVLFDISSVQRDCILLIDTFFEIILRHGEVLYSTNVLFYFSLC